MIFDRFHVQRLAQEAVDAVRRAEVRESRVCARRMVDGLARRVADGHHAGAAEDRRGWPSRGCDGRSGLGMGIT
jgi:transposase